MEEMKEMERQIKMAWERGHEYGLVKGFVIKSNAGTDLLRYTDANLIKRWHKQSIIALYQGEIEIAESKKIVFDPETVPVGFEDPFTVDGYNQALEDQILHYQQIIEELRK